MKEHVGEDELDEHKKDVEHLAGLNLSKIRLDLSTRKTWNTWED